MSELIANAYYKILQDVLIKGSIEDRGVPLVDEEL
jgi:hypothetical protein